MAAILAPNLFLLYRLSTPSELPEVVLPTPNGYDDFVAAGKLAPDDLLTPVRAVNSMNYAQLRALYDQLAALDALVEKGLAKQCRVREPFAEVTSQDFGDMEAISSASVSMALRMIYLQRFASTDEYIAYLIRMLRFEHESTRGGGFEAWSQNSEGRAAWRMRQRLGDLDARGCRLVAQALAEFEQRREPWADKRSVQYLIDQHSGWETHARALLTQWSGADLYQLDYFGCASLAEVRLAMVDAALQAHWLEIGQAPGTLAALMPEYLPEIPLDPFSNEPMQYQRRGATYVVYCVGRDGDDDGGVPEVNPGGDGDIVAVGPYKTPLVERLKRLAYRCEALYWERLAPLVQPTP